MLNDSGERRHPCLVPDFRGNAFKFSPLRITFAVGLSYMAFTMLRKEISPGISLEGMMVKLKLQYSCLENPMERGAWWTTIHRVTKSQTQLNQLSIHAQFIINLTSALSQALNTQ